MALKFIDCNVIYGRRTAPIPRRDETPGGVLRCMDRCGIETAYVTNLLSLEYDPQTGNMQLLKDVRPHSRLKPVWTLLPSGSGEMGNPETLLRRMGDEGVRIARLYPGRHNFVFSEWNLGDLLDALAGKRVPLMIDLRDMGDLDAVYRLTHKHPNLPVILVGAGYRIDRSLIRLLESVSSLYLEISTYKVHLGIERVFEHIGPGRIVFGSGMTPLNAGAAVAMILRADVPEEERKGMAGGTLEKLVSEAQL